MRKSLKTLIMLTALSAGCGSSDPNIVSGAPVPSVPLRPPVTGGPDAPDTTLVPINGGRVTIPKHGEFVGSLEFEPGSEAGNEIVLAASTTPPTGVSLPLTAIDSEQSVTRPFFYLTFSVSKPTPLSLLEAIHLEGPAPHEHEYHHADLFELPSANNGVLAQNSSATHIQAFPGESDGKNVTYDEILHNSTLYPGKEYVVALQTTDHETMTFEVVNESGVWPCYVFITGRDPVKRADDPRFYRVTSDGKFVAMDYTTDVPDPTKERYADYNIEVPEGEGKLSLQLPLMSAGRAYIALGEKHKTEIFDRSAEGGITVWGTPNGWSNPGDPNFLSLWDWVEFDYTITPDSKQAGMGINKTEVQMKSLPFTISMDVGKDNNGNDIIATTGAKEGTRDLLFKELGTDPEFGKLIVGGTAKNTTVSPIRVISPDNGIQNSEPGKPGGVPTFSSTYYDDYITEVWEKYKAEDLTMVTSAFGTFQGRVNEKNEMVFTSPKESSVTIPKPKTIDVIVGTGALTHDINSDPRHNTIVNEIASTMSANFNRSTLLKSSKMYRTFPDTSKEFIDGLTRTFYDHPITNLYSKLIHQHSLPTERAPYGAAYGFGFDDNLEQSSFIANNNNPKKVTVTIKKF